MRRSNISKIISLALSLLMVLTLFPLNARAEKSEEPVAPAAAEYTVRFYIDGREDSSLRQTVLEGEKASKPSAPAVPEGSEEGTAFLYWGLKNDKPYNFDNAVEKDLSLYAVFGVEEDNSADEEAAAPVWTFTFIVDGKTVDTKTVADGETLAEPTAPEAPVAGEHFVGWYTESGAAFTAFGTQSVTENGETVLTAKFESTVYVVRFYDQDGTTVVETREPDSEGVVSTTGVTGVTLGTGETLTGWSTTAGDTTSVGDSVTVSDRDIDLYPIVETVRLMMAMGGPGSTTYRVRIFDTNSGAINISGAGNYGGNDWAYISWEMKPGYEVVSVTDNWWNVDYSYDAHSGTYSYNCYIWWSNHDIRINTHKATTDYTLKYDGNGGKLPNNNTSYSSSVTGGDTFTVDNNQFSRTGYTFLGWSTNSGATSPDSTYTPGGTATMPEQNLTLYAVWKAKTALTLTANSSTVSYNGTVQSVTGFSSSVSGLTFSNLTAGVTGTNAGEYTSDFANKDSLIIWDGTTNVTDQYTVSYVTGKLTINKAALTATAVDRSMTYGDTNTLSPAEAVTYTGFVNGENATSAGIGGSVSYAYYNGATLVTVSNTLPVGAYAIRPNVSGLTAANYTITGADGELTVSKAALTLTANSDTVTYNGTAQSVTGFSSSVSGLTFSNLTAGAIGTDAGERTSDFANKDSLIIWDGTNNVTDQYTVTYLTGKLTINKAALTATAVDRSMTYGDTNTLSPAEAVTYTGFVNGEDAVSAGIGGSVSYSYYSGTTAVTVSNTLPAGTYAIRPNVSGLTAANYTITGADGELTVSKTALTLTANSDTVTYNGTAQSVTGFSGSIAGLTYENLTAGVTGTNAGEYTADFANEDSLIIWDGTTNVTDQYTVSYVTGKLTINKAALTATAVDRSMTYGDTNTLSPAEAVTYTGFVNGENATSAGIGGSVSYAYYNGATLVTVSNTLPVGAYAIRPNVSGLTAANYTITGADGELTVSKATMTLNVTGFSGLYDGTTHYVVAMPSVTSGTTLYYSTTGGNDLSAYSTTNPGVKNVSESKTIYVAAVNPNYETKLGSAAITLTKRSVTLTSGDASRYYNGSELTSTAVTIGGDGFAPNEGFVSVPAASGTITNAGGTANIIVIPDLKTNTLPGNYTITKTEGTLTINKVALTATAVDRNMTYGDTNTLSPAEAVTYTGFVNGEDAVSAGIGGSVSYAYYNGATLVTVSNTLPVGTYAIRPNVSGLTAANYTITGADGKLIVSKATMTLNVTGYSGLYDGTTHYVVATPGATSGTILYYSTTGGTNLTAYSTTNPGVKNVSESKTIYVAAVNPNYETKFGSAAITLTKRSIVLTSASASKMYDGSALQSTNVTITGDGFVGTQGFMWAPYATGLIVNAGSTTNSIYQPPFKLNTTSGNYSVTKMEGTLTITKSNLLTVTAESYNAKYDGLPHILLPIPSVIAGTTIYYSSVGGAYPGDYTLTPPYARNVDDSKVVFIAAVNPNYETAYWTASLTITKRTVTLTSGDASKTYDGTPLTKAGVTVGGDGFVLLEGFNGTPTATGTITNAGSTANTIVVPSLRTGTLTYTKAVNYDIVKVEGTLTVTKAALTATAVDRSMTYGDLSSLTPAEDVTYTGFVNGEDATSAVISGGVTYKYYNSSNAEVTLDATLPAGTYAIRPDVSGLSAANYSFTGADGTLTVNKAVLTATAANRSMTYGDTATLSPADNSVSYTGFANGEDATSAGISGNATYKYYNSSDAEVTLDGTLPAGTYAIRPDVSGLSAANYTFTGADGTLTVNKAVLTATATNRSMIYGDTTTLNPADNSVSYTGFANGEDATSAAVTGDVTYKYYEGAAEVTLDNTLIVGAYAIRPDVTGLSAANYTFTGADGTLTVNQRPVLIRALDAAKNFGDADPAFTYEVPTGLIGTTTYYGILADDVANITVHVFRIGTDEAVGKYADVLSVSMLTTAQILHNYSFDTERADFTINPRVTYDANTTDAVTGMPATAWFEYLGSAAIADATGVARVGYTLTGWVDKDTGDPVALGAVISPIDRNYDLEAVWQPIVYNITYVLNGGANAAANPATYTIESATITLAAPTRLGYNFTGWTPGATIPAGSTGNRTFTATWSDPIEYDITYRMNGGTNAAANPATYTVESATITLADPTREGYDFAGWTPTDTIPAGSTGDRAFTATWSDPLEYTVTYYVTGGTDSGLDGATPYAVFSGVAYGSAVPMPDDPSQVDYTFDGWTTVIPATMPAGNLTIYGTMTHVSRSIETIAEAPVPLAAPAWALLNLIFAVITAIASGVLLSGLMKKREDLPNVRSKKSKAVRLSTLLPAVGAIVAFFLTEKLTNTTMVLTDKWTLMMGGIMAVQAVLATLGVWFSREK